VVVGGNASPLPEAVGGNASPLLEASIGPAPPRRLLLLLEPLLPEVVLVDWEGLSVVLVGALTHVLVGGVAANVVGVCESCQWQA
jgi:hypothetical protein